MRIRNELIAAVLVVGGSTLALSCSKKKPTPSEKPSVERTAAATESAAVSSTGKTCSACTTKECPDPLKAVADECANGRCDALRKCIAGSRCDRKVVDIYSHKTGIDIRSCYCGDDVKGGDYGPCFMSTGTGPDAPHGACKTEIEALAKQTVPVEVGRNFFNLQTPLGALGQLATCQNVSCYDPCL